MPSKQKVLLSNVIGANTAASSILSLDGVNFGNDETEASFTLMHLSSSLSSNPRQLATIKRGENDFIGSRTRPPSSRRASKKARMSMSPDSSESSESYTKTEEVLGCKCVKSSCLKLYCTCFQQGSYCLDTCGCANCLNTTENDGPNGIRSQTMQEILQRRPNAFDQREPKVQTQACLCRKNKCVQLYCACFANGTQCGDECKCIDCENCDDVTEMKISVNSTMNVTTNSSPTITLDQLLGSDVSSSSSSSYKEEKKAPARRYKGAVRTKGESSGCKCAKTKCLKLYCPCFEKGVVCHDGCICSNCKNTTEESGPDGIRTKTIEEVLSRRPLAFDKRVGTSNDVGCICKKTKCLKKYCICFSAGINCDMNKCRCTDCGNGGNDSGEESATNNQTDAIDETLTEPIEPFADLIELKCVETEPPLIIEDPMPLLDVVTLIEEV